MLARPALRLLAFAAFAACLALPAAAQAAPASFGGGGGSGGATSSGGGGGSVNANDISGISSGYWLHWDSRWHGKVYDDSGRNCDNATCYTNGATWTPPGKGGPPEAPDGTSEPVARAVASDVAWTNRCPVSSPAVDSHPAACNIGNPDNRSAISGPGTWGEIHVASPPANHLFSDPFPGLKSIQGNAAFISLRVWRECRLSASTGNYLATGSQSLEPAQVYAGGDKCKAAPIFERTLPASDSTTDQVTYFLAKRQNDQTLGSSDPGARSYANTRPSGGTLYRSCTGSSNAVKARCTFNGGLRAGAAAASFSSAKSFFQKACDPGLAAGTVDYSANELLSEIAYRSDHPRSYALIHKYEPELNAWASGNNNAFPKGLKHDDACKALSEWLSVTWSTSAVSGGKPSWDVNINMIPGRVYAVQAVITDARENILSQSFQLAMSQSSRIKPQTCTSTATGRQVPWTRGLPRPAACVPHDNIYRCFNYSTNSWVPLPAGLSPADRAKYSAHLCPPPCGPACTPRTLASPSVPGVMSFSAPTTAIAGVPSANTVTTAPVRPSGSNLGPDADAHSLWTPRTLQFNLFNAQDDKGGQAAYLDNHQITSAAGGDPAHLPAAGEPSMHWPQGQSPLPGTGQTLTARVPLSAGAGNVWQSNVSVVTRKATLAPDNYYDIADRRASDDVRLASLLGENRYASGWDDTATPVMATGYQPLTMHTCAQPAGANWLPAQWQDPAGGLHACDPNGSLGQNWKVSDAYRLPPVSAGVQVELPSLVTQEADGPAYLRLDAPDALKKQVVSAELWNASDYASRSGGPLYRALFSPDADGQLRFCKPMTPTGRKLWDPQPAYVSKHWDIEGSGPGKEGFHTFADGSGGLGYIPHIPNNTEADDVTLPQWRSYYDDTKFAGVRNANGTWKVKPDSILFRSNATGVIYHTVNAAARAGAYTVIYGRDWWGVRGKDAGSKTLYQWHQKDEMVANPDCAGDYAGTRASAVGADGQIAQELPAGDYVIRYVIAGPVAGGDWGISAKNMIDPTMQWVNRYDFPAQPEQFTQVLSPRTAG